MSLGGQGQNPPSKNEELHNRWIVRRRYPFGTLGNPRMNVSENPAAQPSRARLEAGI